MGAAFDRWLAQPGTLHFLRCLVKPHAVRHGARVVATPVSRCCRRSNAGLSRNQTSKDRSNTRRTKPLESISSRKSLEKLDASEVGLRMSLNAGIAIFDKNGDPSQSYAELEFQSAVNSSDGCQRLVDDPRHRENFQLWVELLRFRQRIHGLEGVLELWQGMLRRSIDLPVEGPEADVLWKTFVDAAFSDPIPGYDLLSELLYYARDLQVRNGHHYQGLYKLMVGRHFRKKLWKLRRWHESLTAAKLRGPHDLASIVEDATTATDPKSGFRIWLSLVDDKVNGGIYDMAIAGVLKLRDIKLALTWHRLLLLNGHAPSSAVFAEPAVQRLFELDKNRSLPMIRSSTNSPASEDGRTKVLQTQFPPLTRASMNTIVGDVHGIKQKEISDSFCARLFATRAFSLDLVIKGLSFLSVENLGPLAIREMAVRAGSPAEMSHKLNDLKALGIKIGSSVYARLVEKAARDHDTRLWNALLETDQHPDVYEDAATQEALIISFLQQRRLNQAQLSLTALSWATDDAQYRAWNRVLQHHIVNRDYTSIYSAMGDMRLQGLPLTLYSLALMRRYLLPERHKGKRAVAQDGRPPWALAVVKNACIHTASKRGFVPINLWVELIKRVGMARKWKSTEGLVLWLVEHYTVSKAAVKRDSDRRTYLGRIRVRRRALVLRLIFSPVMLRALFTWGFRGASSQQHYRKVGNDAPLESWARGLALLRQIQERKLFDVTVEARTSFQQRMWMLFGAGYSTLRTNNLARLYNPFSLAHYINHANQVWPGLVDWVDPELLKEDTLSDPRLLTQFFGSLYRTKRNTLEYANVALWAKHLSTTKRSRYMQLSSTRAKEHAWKHSPIRVILTPDSQILRREEASDASIASDSTPSKPPADVPDAKYQPFAPPERQSPSARSSNWRPPPSPRYIPAPP